MKNAEEILSKLETMQAGLQAANPTEKPALMEALYRLAGMPQPTQVLTALKNNARFLELASYFRTTWLALTSDAEFGHSEAIIQKNLPPATRLSPKRHLGNYSRSLTGLYSGATRDGDFVMVGAGAFPETLMQTYLETDFRRYVGIDQREHAVILAAKVFPLCIEVISAKPVNFVTLPAESYDYTDASVILIANSAHGKLALLRSIRETMRDNAIIVLRNCNGLGSIIYEQVESQEYKALGLRHVGKEDFGRLVTHALTK